MNETTSRSSKRVKEIKNVQGLMNLSMNVDRQDRESMINASELEKTVQLQMLTVLRMTLKTWLKQNDLLRGESLATKLILWCEHKYEEENEQNEKLQFRKEHFYGVL